MHVYASARLLAHMRVSEAQACQNYFYFLDKNFLKNFCPQWGFPVWHGISRDARSYIGFASYIALRQLYLPNGK